MESKGVVSMKIIFVVLSLSLIGCNYTKKNDSFELTLTSCYAMKADKSHRYWKQPIAVQGCEMLITEYELKELGEKK
jgi:hypothetical protein